MAGFPRDTFDDIPRGTSRIGAHRAPGPRGRGWIGFGWAVVAVAVLTVGGLLALSTLNPNLGIMPPGMSQEETPTPEPEVIETMAPVTDPASVDPAVLAALTISVLNGTPTDGLSAVAGDQIAAAGWPSPTRAAASLDTETETIVYYSTPESEGIARGLMLLIGAVDVRLTDAFPQTTITIVLGSDYVPPVAG